MQPICISLDPTQIDRLEAEARETGEPSLSAVIRSAVSEHIRRQDKRREREANNE